MKNLKNLISAFVITLFIGATAYANTPTKSSQKKELRTELVNLLGNLEELNKDSKVAANVSFIINEKNEIVVISVDSNNKEVAVLVKGKLNYKKVLASGIERGEVYEMPLKIEKLG